MEIEREMLKNKRERVNKTWLESIRFQQTLILFFCMIVIYTVRTSISVAVIAMSDMSNNTKSQVQTYNWTKKQQDYILSSFMWGYSLMQIPAGTLTFRFGGKYFLASALLSSGLFSILMPIAAKIGSWKAVCVCRILQGFFQGFFVPSVHTLISRWAPLSERNRIGLFIYSGSNIGTIMGVLPSGYLASTKIGWPLIFYLIGGICLFFATIWLIFGEDSPSKHKSISKEEKRFIIESLGEDNTNKKFKIPVLKIITCVPFLALVIAQIGAVFGFTVMLTETPSYLKMALGLDLGKSGALTAIFYASAWVSAIIGSFIADFFLNRKYCSVSTVRKTANTIGTWGPALALIFLTFIPAGYTILAVMILTLIISLDAINSLGFLMNHIDLAPNYAGVLLGITNCLAAATCHLGPIIAGIILKDPTDILQWRLLFYISAGVYFISNLLFIIFGKAEIQSWNKIEENNKNRSIKEELEVELQENLCIQ